jgi:hypothetical protein
LISCISASDLLLWEHNGPPTNPTSSHFDRPTTDFFQANFSHWKSPTYKGPQDG